MNVSSIFTTRKFSFTSNISSSGRSYVASPFTEKRWADGKMNPSAGFIHDVTDLLKIAVLMAVFSGVSSSILNKLDHRYMSTETLLCCDYFFIFIYFFDFITIFVQLHRSRWGL